MVKIEQGSQWLRMFCSKCGVAKSMSCNAPFSDIDAILEMCPNCFGDELVAKVRQYQLSEGNPDCFAKSEDFCDQHLCKFRQTCLGMERRV